MFKKKQYLARREGATIQLVERQRVRVWNGMSEVQISGRLNQMQCCQRLATAAIFL